MTLSEALENFVPMNQQQRESKAAIETEVERLRLTRRAAKLEGEIPREIVEKVAKLLGVKTGQWTGQVEDAISAVKDENEGLKGCLNMVYTELKNAGAKMDGVPPMNYGDVIRRMLGS